MANARQVSQQNAPIIFLFGPPGAGKTTLGRRACDELGLKFVDLTAGAGAAAASSSVTTDASDEDRLRSLVAARAADVIELPWPLQSERKVLALTRESGIALLLWAHPEDVLARSGGFAAGLLTPVPRLKTRGGFGRTGAGCREFRRLDRACGTTLMLVDLSIDAAARAVTDCISLLRQESCSSPAEREGVCGWVDGWHQDHDANRDAAEIIVDAMARYLSRLRSVGRSPRTLAGIRSDLNAAGQLVLMYDAPTGGRVLESFDSPPWEFEFRRKFTDSPTLTARYRRSLEGFARFLRDCDPSLSEE